MEYHYKGLERFVDWGKKNARNVIVDTSSMNLIGESLKNPRERIKWCSDFIYSITDLEDDGINVVVIREVVKEFSRNLRNINNRLAGLFGPNERNRFNNTDLKNYRLCLSNFKTYLIGKDPTGDFSEEEQKDYDLFLRFAGDVHNRIERERSENHKVFLDKQKTYGSKLKTDIKIAATTFSLARRGQGTLTITKDNGMRKVIESMVHGSYNKDIRDKYSLPYVPLRNVKVRNICDLEKN